jgi:hypothetical protein
MRHLPVERMPARLLGCLLVTLLAACNPDAGAAPPAEEPLFTSAPSDAAVPIIRIRPHGLYFIGNDPAAVPEDQLPSRIQEAVSAHPSGNERTLRVLAYPGVLGYDLAVVTNAARAVDVQRIEGIAEYTDDASPLRKRTEWKRWVHDLEPLPAAGRESRTDEVPVGAARR